MPVNIIPKEKWGGKPPESTIGVVTPVREVIHSFTGTDECFNADDCAKLVRDLQLEHMGSGLPDIKYNFIIGGDGNVYEGRGWLNRPDLNMEHPDHFENSIEIAQLSGPGKPSKIVNGVIKELINLGCELNHIRKGHKYTLDLDEKIEEVEEYTTNHTGLSPDFFEKKTRRVVWSGKEVE